MSRKIKYLIEAVICIAIGLCLNYAIMFFHFYPENGVRSASVNVYQSGEASENENNELYASISAADPDNV